MNIADEFYKLMKERRYDTYEEHRKEVARVFVDVLGTLCNEGDNSQYERIAERFNAEHRTIQQQIFSLFLHICSELAERYKENRYDARNEYACKMAAKIIELVESPHVPLI